MAKSPTASTTYALFEAKLTSSGLTTEDAELLGMTPLSADAVTKLHHAFEPRDALHIPYFTLHGEPTGFYRLRYLSKPKGFAALAASDVRYTQPPGTKVYAYFPQNIDWAATLDVINDTLIKIKVRRKPGRPPKNETTEGGETTTKVVKKKLPIYITEGELKAAKACKHGYPTVGLGGVFSWMSAKNQQDFLPELDVIDWQERAVYIVFDSDFVEKPQVGLALRRLCEKLTSRGAMPQVVTLPPADDGAKVGLDDYLLAHDESAFELLTQRAEPWRFAVDLWQMNTEVAYIKNPGLVVMQENGDDDILMMSPGAFITHHYANRKTYVPKSDKDGNIKLVEVPLPKEWIEWPKRLELRKMIYEPGQPRIHNGCFNAWPGWGCEPAVTYEAEELVPWNDMLNHLFAGADPAHLRWFVQWLAYPLQHPGAKLLTYVFMHGIHHGTGKSTIGYTMKRIYGRAFNEIKQDVFDSDYTDWGYNKSFIMIDDYTATNDRVGGRERLKTAVSQQELRVNIKYVPAFKVRDTLNYFITSNQPDGATMEDRDRRGFVHEVKAGPQSRWVYDAYRDWLDTGGAEVLFAHLLSVDLEGFDPYGHAPMTAAKEKMIMLTKSDIGVWVQQLLDDPDAILMGSPYDLFTSADLMALYDPEGKTRLSLNGLARELRRAGIDYVNDGRPVKRAGTPMARYYAVRNQARWAKADHATLSAHLEQPQKRNEKGRY